MIAARGVTELLHKVGQHFFENTRIHRRRRVIIHVDGQLDPIGSALLSVVLAGWGGRLAIRRPVHLLLKSAAKQICYEIVINSGFLLSGLSTLSASGSSLIGEILMFFKTCSMLSFTFRNGSRIVQRSLWSHSPRIVTHDVMNSGPSMALITSNAEIIFGSRVSVYPPFMPCCDRTKPTFASRCRIFARASCGIPYASATSFALHAPWSTRSARCFMAMSP